MTRIWISTAAAASAAIALLPVAALAQASSDPDRYGWGPHMMGWGGGWFGMIFGPVFMILVLALVIAVAVLLVRWLGGPARSTRRSLRSVAASSANDPHSNRRQRA